MKISNNLKKYLNNLLKLYNKKSIKFNFSLYSCCLSTHLGLELSNDEPDYVVDGVNIIINENNYKKLLNAKIDIKRGDFYIEFLD
jgi:hypothetical protein